MKKRVVLLCLLCLLLAIGAGVVAETAELALPWHVIAGGGGTVRSDEIALRFTVGQPVIGAMTDNGRGRSLWSGYWPGIARSSPAVPGQSIFVPMILSTR